MTTVNGREVVDSLGMWESVSGIGGRAREAVAAAEAFEGLPGGSPVPPVSSVVVVGMGASGISGDILAATAAGRMAVPVIGVKDYGLPAFVGPDSLVFGVSHSGNTEESLEATTAALDRGANVIAVTSGGEMADLAARRGLGVVPVPADAQPRAMIAALVLPLIVVTGRLGLLPGADDDVAEAISCIDSATTRMGSGAPEDRNEALAIARRLDRKLPLVYGSSGPGSVAAYHWKCGINEIAKAPAFCAEYPELDHNEICGWGQHGDLTRQALSIVQLRRAGEHPQVERRIEITAELIEEAVAEIIEVTSDARTPLGSFLDLAIVGDYVSLYLAALAEVDPGPVEVIDRLKAGLSS